MQQLRKALYGAALVALLAVAAVSAQELRTVAEDDSKWLLGDAEIIMKVNIKQMLASDVITKNGGLAKIKEAINGNEQAKGIIDATGIDVTKDVDSILLSAAGTNPADAKMRFVLRGRFDPEKIHAAMAKAKEIKISKDGTTNLYEMSPQDQTVIGAFADKNTFVVTQSKEATLEAVKTGGKAAAKMNKDMKSALAKFTGKESLALAVVINDDLKKQIASAPRVGDAASKLQTVTAGITLGSEVDLNIRGITGEEKSAAQLGKLIEALKATAALAGEEVPKAALEIIDAIKVAADKESVKVDLKVTKELIEKAQKGGPR